MLKYIVGVFVLVGVILATQTRAADLLGSKKIVDGDLFGEENRTFPGDVYRIVDQEAKIICYATITTHGVALSCIKE